MLPQYREYERTSTTAINGLLGPRMSNYLRNMSGALDDNGIHAPLHLMQSNGGVLHWQEAARMPCRVVNPDRPRASSRLRISERLPAASS